MHQGLITHKCLCTNFSTMVISPVRILKDLINILETCLPMELKEPMNNQTTSMVIRKVKGEERGREVVMDHHKEDSLVTEDPEIEKDLLVVVAVAIIIITIIND